MSKFSAKGKFLKKKLTKIILLHKSFGATKMHSNIWLSLIVLCSLVSGYYTQMHFVSDEEEEDSDNDPTPSPSPGVKDTDGYCFFEDK